MSWNYRVVKERLKGEDIDTFGICEVFYDKEGRVYGVTEPILFAESMAELEAVFLMVGEAFEKKVLDKTDHGEIMKMAEPGQW